MGKYDFGIDLGTTNSVIAVMRGSGKKRPVVIPVDGHQTLPSCVQLVNGDFVVGHSAYANRFKSSAIYSVKRFMGTDKIIKLIDDVTGNVVELTPTEVSAEILKKLKVSAESVYGIGNVVDVTITVPAAFNHIQREETRKAGELAGFNVVKIINEPTAAALVYGLNDLESNECIAVYDLGGGTFDISIVSVTDNSCSNIVDVYDIIDLNESADLLSYRVVTKEGDTRLGGDDIDSIVLKLMLKELDEKMRVVPCINSNSGKVVMSCEESLLDILIKEDFEKMLLFVEEYKKSNSSSVIYKTTVRLITGETADLEFVLRAEHLNKAVEEVYSKTKFLLDKCLRRLGSLTKINKIVLVGGSTKSAKIKEFLKRDYDFNIFSNFNPDESVGLGAAIQTSISKGESSDVVLDIVPDSIGVETVSNVNGRVVTGLMSRIIKRDELIPTSNKQEFTTTVDNQKEVSVAVYQGSSEYVEDNAYLGNIIVPLKEGPKGSQIISVKLVIDGDGILTCLVEYDGRVYEQKLVNIFGISREVKQLTPESKKYKKWMQRYKTLGLDCNELLAALTLYDDKPNKDLEKLIVELFDNCNSESMKETSVFV